MTTTRPAVPALAAAVLAVLTSGVVAAAALQPAAPVAEVRAAAPAPVRAAVAPVLDVVPAAEVAPEPVAPVAAAAPPPAPVAAAPAAPAAVAPPAPAPAPAAAAPAPPAPVDPLCTGAGWEQRRGEAALASLRRPADAAAFTVTFEGRRDGFIGLATVHERRLQVFVRSCDELSDGLLRHVVAHELGHLVDGDRMTDALREEYKRLRGIPAETPWYGCNSCADFATPAGDFAEAYAQWQTGGAAGNRSELAPPPSAAELAELAARFFG